MAMYRCEELTKMWEHCENYNATVKFVKIMLRLVEYIAFVVHLLKKTSIHKNLI